MISRRTFISATVTAPIVGSLVGPARSSPSETPQTGVTLTLYFVGGTVFRRLEQGCLAVQLSGKGFVHSEHKDRPMAHRSFLVAPESLPFDGKKFDPDHKKYPTKNLHPDLKHAKDYQAVCLVDKDVVISHSGGVPFAYQCEEVADYYWLSRGWDLKGTWYDPDQPRGAAVSSRFVLKGGILSDGDPVNEDGYDHKWTVGNGAPKKLSDVAILTLSAQTITITGLSAQPYNLDRNVKLYVLSGPEGVAGQEGKEYEYHTIEHALLLSTIYKIPEGAEICPQTENRKKIKGKHKKVEVHPCDFDRQQAGLLAAPPDSEYCSNYDHLP